MPSQRALIFLSILVALLLLGAVATFTGLVTYQDTDAGVVVRPDNVVTFENGDLRTCCTFTLDGEQKTCSVLQQYDCSYCNEYCAT